MTVADRAAVGAGRADAGLSVLLACAVFVAATPALAAYQVAGAGATVAVAAGASVLISFGAARFARLVPAASYGLSVTALGCLLLAADGAHPASVARAVVHGPNRLLTDTLPLGGSRAAVSALVLLVWVCGAATGEIAGRASGPARRGLSLAVPVLLFVVCFAVASSAPGEGRYSGPLLLCCLAAAAAVSHVASHPAPEPSAAVEDDKAASRRRAVPTAMVAAASAASALALLAPTVPGLDGPPAGFHRQPPTATPVITDPVDTMAQLRDGRPGSAPRPELTVTLSGAASGYLAAAYLDLYDGGQWRFSGDFQPTGGRIPSGGGSAGLVSNARVSQHVVVTGSLPVPLLPALDRPRYIKGPEVAADQATGMLLPQSGHADGSYTVESDAPSESLAGLSPADSIDQSADGTALELPPDTSSYLATTLRFLSSLTGRRPTGDVAFLQDALQALRTGEKRIDPVRSGSNGASTAPTTAVAAGGRGTSLSEVINAVTVNRAATPEQFATFYAMIARYLGVPARVVTGFRLAGPAADRLVPAGTYQVTNRQAWTWVEVPVTGVGWVVCDPTPAATTAADTAPPEALSAPATTVPPRQANAVPRNQDAGGHALAAPQRVHLPRRSHVAAWVPAALGAAGLLLAIAVIGPGQAAFRRYLRRRRRAGPDPARLAVGAWLELLDGLERAGMPPPVGATASEVAGEIGHHFGAELVERARTVAETADLAVFSLASTVASTRAVDAWNASQALCRQVRAGLDTRQKVRCWCAVGSAPSRPDGRSS